MNKCKDCSSEEGTLLKDFDNSKNYSWYDLSQMSEVCANCGSENIEKGENDVNIS